MICIAFKDILMWCICLKAKFTFLNKLHVTPVFWGVAYDMLDMLPLSPRHPFTTPRGSRQGLLYPYSLSQFETHTAMQGFSHMAASFIHAFLWMDRQVPSAMNYKGAGERIGG